MRRICLASRRFASGPPEDGKWTAKTAAQWESEQTGRKAGEAPLEGAGEVDGNVARQRANKHMGLLTEMQKQAEGHRYDARGQGKDPWAPAEPELSPAQTALDRARGGVQAKKDALARRELRLSQRGGADERDSAAEDAEREEARRLDKQDVEDDVAEFQFATNLKPAAEAQISGFYDLGTDRKEETEARAKERPTWVVSVNEDNYNAEVEEEPLPVILDCWAPQCADSVSLSATMRLMLSVVNEKKTLIKLCPMDCNENYNLTLHLNVHSLPTRLAIHEGELLEQQAGLVDDVGMAQFIFGYVQAVYGDEALAHITEDLPVSQLIDGRAAIVAQDWTTALNKYSKVYGAAMAAVVEEQRIRKENAEKGIFEPTALRPLSNSEVLAAKALAGMCLAAFHMRRFRFCKQIWRALKQDLPKAFSVLSDVRKTMATVDVLILSKYEYADDLEELEDEERIDQHNLDLKARLIGAYFMGGDYHKALTTSFILLRKNRDFRDGLGKALMMRIMMYLGRHHPIKEEHMGQFNEILRVPYDRVSLPSSALRRALNEAGGSSPNADEIPLMIDPTPFVHEKFAARHPLLR